MKPRFFNLFQSLKDSSNPISDSDLYELLTYVKWMIERRFAHYGSLDLKNDPSLAEVLSQETIARLYGCIHRFDESIGTPKNWIDGILLNVIKEYFNKNNQQQRLKELLRNPRSAVTDHYVNDISPEDTYIEKENLLLYKRGLLVMYDRFPQYYQLLYYRVFLELSSDETAELLKCKSADVYRNLNRAISKLKGIINQL